jgi:methylenetetrahydrofolate reductase (NADPH)
MLALRATPPGDSLAQRLAAGRFVVTAEVVPPTSCDPSDLLAKALPLRGLADAVNATDGAGAHAHMGVTAAAALMINAGIEPILQLCCRDRNRIALQAELMGAAALGVRNILLLRGDDTSAGDQPDARPVFDLDSRRLVETARGIRDERRLPNGAEVAGAVPFFIGVADTPVDPPIGWQPEALKAKIAAGADFVQTQICMDTAIVRRYAAALIEAGIAGAGADAGGKGRVFVLIGVTAPRSARSLRWIRHHLVGTIIADDLVARLERAADPAAEGRLICIETIAELATIPGVAGAHVMAPGNDAAVPEVIAAARPRIAGKRA